MEFKNIINYHTILPLRNLIEELNSTNEIYPSFLIENYTTAKETIKYIYQHQEITSFSITLPLNELISPHHEYFSIIANILAHPSYFIINGLLTINILNTYPPLKEEKKITEQFTTFCASLGLNNLFLQYINRKEAYTLPDLMFIFGNSAEPELTKSFIENMEKEANVYFVFTDFSRLKELMNEIQASLALYPSYYLKSLMIQKSLSLEKNYLKETVINLNEKVLSLSIYKDFLIKQLYAPNLVGNSHQLSDIAKIKQFYHNEYEVLPLWFKRLGHIIKILTGKRSLSQYLKNSNSKTQL